MSSRRGVQNFEDTELIWSEPSHNISFLCDSIHTSNHFYKQLSYHTSLGGVAYVSSNKIYTRVKYQRSGKSDSAELHAFSALSRSKPMQPLHLRRSDHETGKLHYQPHLPRVTDPLLTVSSKALSTVSSFWLLHL